jgi:hypothetical protein
MSSSLSWLGQGAFADALHLYELFLIAAYALFWLEPAKSLDGKAP